MLSYPELRKTKQDNFKFADSKFQARPHYKILSYLKMVAVFTFNVELFKMNSNILVRIAPVMFSWDPRKDSEVCQHHVILIF